MLKNVENLPDDPLQGKTIKQFGIEFRNKTITSKKITKFILIALIS